MKTYAAGKPPAPDWYEVKPSQPTGPRVGAARRMFRWWDGEQWSIPASEILNKEQAATAAALKVSKTLLVQWTPVKIDIGESE